MSKIFDLVPDVAWAASLVLLGLFAMAQTFRLDATKVDLAKSLVAIAEARATASDRLATIATLTRENSEKAREFETQAAKTAAENADANATSQTKIAELGAALADVQRRVRAPAIAAYATGGRGSSGPTPDPALGVSFEDRAEKLGVLLETCRSEVDSDAAEFEQLAEQTRGLQGHVKVIEQAYGDYWGSAVDHR